MKVGIIIDIIIILIIGLSTYVGYKKGLTKSFLKIFNFLIALVLSIILFKPVSMLVISNTQIDETIQEAIVSSFEQNEKESIDNEGNSEESKSEENDKNKNSGLPAIFSDYIENTIKTKVDETKDLIIKESAMYISEIIINIAVAIILFIVIRIILIFIKGIAELVTKIPGIKQCDELCGGIFGFARAVVIVIGIFTVLSLMGPIIQNTQFAMFINDSIIGGYLYNNNILFTIFF